MATLNLQAGASGDDSDMQSIADNSGRAVTASGTVSLTRSVLSPGSHNSGDEWSVAARFTGVTIDNAAPINTAAFQMRANSSYSASPSVVKYWISAQASDNAGALSGTSGDLNITARARSTATAVIDVTSVTVGTWYSTDMTAVIQEIVNRAGWANGNAIVILVDTHWDCDVGEWQDFDSYDGAAAGAPKLDIDYGAAATGQPVSFRGAHIPGMKRGFGGQHGIR